jgi:hypothetical protein
MSVVGRGWGVGVGGCTEENQPQIPNLASSFTKANLISVYKGLEPVPRLSFFVKLAGDEKYIEDLTHMLLKVCVLQLPL